MVRSSSPSSRARHSTAIVQTAPPTASAPRNQRSLGLCREDETR
ncbi:hypothetical protein AZ78_5188 [Lysobacter capsici AZ78]|uniref:Uncharacterized protein n=1 Tax=Lysobacter capsici AZ78 TaxID=1444315 RepID=A0A125TZH1_9GAMM|nr:hypothetical protein AZ78_5188 [Lysobacter capsici AZ78]